MIGMRRFLQSYGHTGLCINGRLIKHHFDWYMGKKQSYLCTSENRHLSLHKYYMSTLNRPGKIGYFNLINWKNIDLWPSSTKKYKNNSRKLGTTVISETKICQSVTLPYCITVESKASLRNFTQNGWDLMLSKKYIPMGRSD